MLASLLLADFAGHTKVWRILTILHTYIFVLEYANTKGALGSINICTKLVGTEYYILAI